MNKFILKTISIALLCSVAASCDGDDDGGKDTAKDTSQATFTELNSKIAKIEAENKRLSQILQAAQDRSTSSETALSEIKIVLSDLQKRVETSADKEALAKLESALGELQKNLDGKPVFDPEQLKEIKASLEALQKSIADNLNLDATAKKAVNDRIDGLSATLAGLVDNLAAITCSRPELDDTAALEAVLKNPPLPGKFPPMVPVPVFGELPAGDALSLTSATKIITDGTDSNLNLAANYLQTALKASTGFPMLVNPMAVTKSPCIKLEIKKLKTADGKEIGEEGYSLISGKDGVVIRSSSGRGLFNGVQTLLQLLPAKVYSKTVQPASWTVPAVKIVDWPRFAYRGTMLDVARTFFTVDEVKRYIDQIALLKINTLHLHLTDDQGWRIAIDELPVLTEIGASAQVNSPSSPSNRWFYSREQYKDIVAYATRNFITIVPEIEGPGHATAARASLPELTCPGSVAPTVPSSGNGVGTPIICLTGDENIAKTKAYLTTVISSITALTPGPYVHIGSDETSANKDQMAIYTATASAAAAKKTLMAWNELARGTIPSGTVLQYWGSPTDHVTDANNGLKMGAKVVLAPSQHAYLDFEYHNDPKGYGHS